MSFREKSAWISLISILLVSGFFFRHVPSMIHIRANVFAMACHLLLAFVVAEVVNYATRIVYHRRGF